MCSVVRAMDMEGALILWYFLTLLSLIFVVWDHATNTPSVTVMKWAWWLVILYTGPIGLFFYLLTDRQPLPGTHSEYIKAHWKQALGSEIHCVAGDATAIIIMAIVLSFFHISNGLEATVEYIAAYLFGLFIFQALFMLNMFSSYKEAVIQSIFAETVSMNFVMAGMLPTIFLFRSYYPEAANPSTLHFWGGMSLATLVGFLLAYPINSWMVKHHIKHGMMTKGMKHEHHACPQITSGKKWGLSAISFVFLFTVWFITQSFHHGG